MRKVMMMAGALAAAGAAQAEEQPPHEEIPPEIVVTAPYLRERADLLSGVSVLQGARLQTELRPTIGETLQRLPGVSSTSFGPNASRPVLRGLDAERVRVLTDGIGSIDVSNTSADHAVVINPLLAERVEVIRGPASLLYGSSAIGGVVNVRDLRIPRAVPPEALHLDALGALGSAATERSAGGALDVPLSDRIVAHVDGSYLRTDDQRIGGFLLSPALRATAAANGFPDLAIARGRVPNTAARTWDVGGGLALITAAGEAGFALSHYDSIYGVPVRFGLDPARDDERVRLAVKQDRLDARAEVKTFGFIDTVRFRLGMADYRHSEIGEDGAVGTTFFNRGLEGRLELAQRAQGGWRGASGVQVAIRDFDVVGDEAFVPKNETVQAGVFTLQEYDAGVVKLEAGGRYERTNVRSDTIGAQRSFDAFSGSLGGSLSLGGAWRLGLNLSHTERAPAAEELFADGPHAGTQAYEVGDPGFAKERANGAELTLRGRGEGYRFEANAYYTRFRNFIVLAPNGEEEDELPVFTYRQAGARYYGLEAEGTVRLAGFGETELNADGLVDWVHATILDAPGDSPAPRIPPLRVLAGLEATGPQWSVRAEVEHTTRQNRIAAFETATPAFTLVNASASLKPFGDRNRTTLVLSASNIFNVEARRHASFLKDYAPLSGRDIRLSLRVNL